ncbi:hypothetical protein D3C72_1687920 [compost metagenome]
MSTTNEPPVTDLPLKLIVPLANLIAPLCSPETFLPFHAIVLLAASTLNDSPALFSGPLNAKNTVAATNVKTVVNFFIFGYIFFVLMMQIYVETLYVATYLLYRFCYI